MFAVENQDLQRSFDNVNLVEILSYKCFGSPE